MDGLASAWVSAVAALGGRREAALASAAELAAAYAAPTRHYHSSAHVTAVLGHVAVLAPAVGLSGRDRAVVELAACAHDVVYEGRAGEDERASAAWAAERLETAGLMRADIDRVAELVERTATHRSDGDPPAAVLCDADLAVLGADPDRYDAYVRAVRADYADVPDEGWRAGRAAVLRSLVQREPLYATPAGREAWEQRARRNLAAELASLGES